jgi:hypothetical protein
MKTFTQSIDEILTLTENDTVENEANCKIWFNQSLRTVASIRNGKWKWLETVETVNTVANQQTYQVPNKIRKVTDVYVTVGTGSTAVIYMPIPVFDPFKWKEVLSSRLGYSDVPRFYYVQDDVIYFSPIPQTSSNVISIRGRVDLRDMVMDDYSTGTITDIANGGTTVTGSGTTWTTGMAGSYIRITFTGAANVGDGFWYKIASVTSATVLELSKPYQGDSIVAGSATYTIGQVSVIPEAYQDAPIYRTIALYWGAKGNTDRSALYWRMYDGGVEAGLSKDYGGLIGQMLEESGETVEGSYVSPNDYQRFDPNNPQPDSPIGSFN